VVLNVPPNPKFYERLERIVTNYKQRPDAADKSGGFAPIRNLRKLPFWAANGLENGPSSS